MASRFENGPYNLLSLDGGGVRGVSELVILDAIMKKVQKREGLDKLPKPCDYFHLIGGTSTGGLIAIMLGRLRMSTTEALDEYNSFAKKIFRKINRRFHSVSSQFRETTLETVIKEVAKKYSPTPEASDLMRDPNRATGSWLGRSFVCARPSTNQDRGPVRIRAYPSEDDWGKECKIWEAARATSAAPLYFKPISITSGGVKEDFIDPALGCNNPTAEVLDEAGEILDASCKLGCLLSLGTGTRPKNLKKARGIARNLELFKLLKDYTTDSERTHADMRRRFTDFPSTYFRFSVPNAAAKIGMAKHKKIGKLRRMTEQYLASAGVAAEIEKVVDILCEGKTENVTIGHVRYPNKAQIIVDKRRANTGGIASKLFTGRTEILDKLSAYFSKRTGNTGPQREFLLYGMGGVGKTQIALKFKQMMESEKRFGRVIFVDATDSTTIEECYNELAAKLPHGQGARGTTARERVVNWMDNTSEEWLLIMDNCNDDDQPITRFLPSTDKGNMLYTARPDHLKVVLKEAAIEVDKMEEEEAITLLLKAVGESTDSLKNRTMAFPIVQELGCLPLAIDQAGAYIYTDKCSLPDYLALFQKKKQSMLRNSPYGPNHRDLPVYATFDLSHKVLVGYAKGKRGLSAAETAATAIKILSFICFYHNQGIMEEMVKRAAEDRLKNSPPLLDPLGEGRLSLEDLVRIEQGNIWDPDSFRNAVRLLESLSIIKRDRGRNISMHVLVHSWARDRMSDEERDSLSRSARTILYDSIPFSKESDSVLYRRRVAPHLNACESLVKVRAREEVENLYLARRAAVTKDAGRLDDACEMWEQVVRDRKFSRGPEEESVFWCSFQLGSTYLSGARFSQAEALFTELLERARGVFPEASHWLIDIHFMLVKVYTDIGLAQAALKHLEIYIRLVDENPTKKADFPDREEVYHDLQALTGHHNGSELTNGPLLRLRSLPPRAELWEQYEEAVRVNGMDGEVTLKALIKLARSMREDQRATCATLIAETVASRYRHRYGYSFHRLVGDALEVLARAYYLDGFAVRAQETQRENLEYHLAFCGTDSFHTKHQQGRFNDFMAYPEFAKKKIEEFKRGTATRRMIPRLLEAILREFKNTLAKSVCHTLPCGQTRHAELISRLGLEEKYPDGVLVTPDDIGFRELGIDVDSLLSDM